MGTEGSKMEIEDYLEIKLVALGGLYTPSSLYFGKNFTAGKNSLTKGIIYFGEIMSADADRKNQKARRGGIRAAEKPRSGWSRPITPS